MRKNIFWGALFLISAVLLILDALGITFGLPESISVWKIILSVALLFWIFEQIIKKHVENVFFPLIFIIMLFEKELASLLKIESGDIASTWMFLLIALLLTVGTALIFKSGFTFTFTNKDGKYVYSGKEGVEKFKEVLKQESINYVDCSNPVNKEIEVNMGKTEIFFTNADLYDGNGKINIDNNMGKIIIHLPVGWIADCEINNSLGSIKMAKPDYDQENIKKIKFTGENNMGKIEFLND